MITKKTAELVLEILLTKKETHSIQLLEEENTEQQGLVDNEE